MADQPTSRNEQSDDESSSIAGLGYHGRDVFIDGVRLSPDDCPVCLEREKGNCAECDFFDPGICLLMQDAAFKEDLVTLFDLYRKQSAAQSRRPQALIRAARIELQAHGRPLHYTVLAAMIAKRFRQLKVTERGVMLILALHPEEFECLEPGVYQCK
jgi:hypothetical protein